jgi:DNA-binding GntR family transcriptional regulator
VPPTFAESWSSDGPGAGGGPLSATDRLFGELKTAIITGALAPGATVSEPDLAARYGVSKTPVREALRLLAHAGWVRVLPRKGYLVRPLGLTDIKEVFALRRVLEPLAAADAARHSTEEGVAVLSALVEQQRSNAASLEVVVAVAAAWHLQIADMSGNRRARHALVPLVDEVSRLMHLMPRLESNLRSVTELGAHETVTQAIADRDAERAADLMRAHIVVAGRALAQAFVDET